MKKVDDLINKYGPFNVYEQQVIGYVIVALTDNFESFLKKLVEDRKNTLDNSGTKAGGK